MKPQVIILLGPTGAGKTTIGRIVQNNTKAVFLPIEEFFMQRYSSLELFRAHKKEAYATFETLVHETLSKNKQVIFEEVGANSEAFEMIQKLVNKYHSVIIRVDAPTELTVKRVQTRGTTHNYPKDDSFVIATRARFETEALPKYTFAATINNNNLSESQILEELKPFIYEQ